MSQVLKLGISKYIQSVFNQNSHLVTAGALYSIIILVDFKTLNTDQSASSFTLYCLLHKVDFILKEKEMALSFGYLKGPLTFHRRIQSMKK